MTSRLCPLQREAPQDCGASSFGRKVAPFLLPGKYGLNRLMVRPYEKNIANMASLSAKFAETAIAGIMLSHYNNVRIHVY